MRNEACVWCRVGVTITEQSSPKTGKKWENSLIVLTERCQTHSACSGPRLVLSLVLNLIPSKSDQSLLPNWAICTWVATNKKQSVGFPPFICTSPTFRDAHPDVICRVDS